MRFATVCRVTTMRLSGCSPDAAPSIQASRSRNDVLVDDISVVHTPPGGCGNAFPPPVLETCTEREPDETMVWIRPDRGFTMTLERIGGPSDTSTRRDLPEGTTGGSGLPPPEGTDA